MLVELVHVERFPMPRTSTLNAALLFGSRENFTSIHWSSVMSKGKVEYNPSTRSLLVLGEGRLVASAANRVIM